MVMRKADGVGVIPVKCDGSKMSGMCAEVVGKVGTATGRSKVIDRRSKVK